MADAEEAWLTAALIEARRTGIRLDAAGGRGALRDEAAAYRVQASVAAWTGEVGGWKTGRRGAGGPQIMAPIPRDVVRASPARFEPGELGPIGIELEIGFHVVAPLPPASAPDFEAQARSCVTVAAMVEVVDARIRDPEGADPLLKLADNQGGGGLVAGPARERFGELTSAAVELRVGAERVEAGRAEVPGGDAFDVFCGFARMVGDHCGGLGVGQHVTTGTLTPLRFVGRGQTVRGRIEGLGEVVVEFPA